MAILGGPVERCPSRLIGWIFVLDLVSYELEYVGMAFEGCYVQRSAAHHIGRILFHI